MPLRTLELFAVPVDGTIDATGVEGPAVMPATPWFSGDSLYPDPPEEEA